MAYNFGDAVGFPETESDTEPVDSGRLGGLFCRLQRRAFTGLLHVETADTYGVFSFRNGSIVFVEQSTLGDSAAEHMIERGLITRDQYADVISHMTDSLVDNEDIVFCEQAVARGYLTPEQIDEVMTQRVRAKVMQALSYSDCKIEVDDSPEALVLAAEYPQPIGEIVYIGVCTFYDEELLQTLLPDPTRHYMRLLQGHRAIAAFFAFDANEEKFLRSLDSEAKVITFLRSPLMERTQALRILALLRIAGFAEFATSPYVNAPEPSGVRSASQVSRGVVSPAPTMPRPGQARVGATDPRREPPSRVPAFVAAREVVGPVTGERRIPVARDERDIRATFEGERAQREPSSARTSGNNTAQRSAKADAAGATQRRAPQPDNEIGGRTRNTASSRSGSGNMRVDPGPARAPAATAQPQTVIARAPASAPRDEATAQALAEAKARAAQRAAGGAIGSGAMQRLGKQLSHLRGPGSVAAMPPAAAVATVKAAASPLATAASDNPEYAKAHLKEILKRRRQVSNAGAVTQAMPQKRDPAADLKQAHEYLREQQFGRAAELFQALLDLDPQNEPLVFYTEWAKLRSSQDPERKDSDAMRDLARKMIQTDDHGAFACYVLGHLAFVEKKDDVAEKFFRKAFTRDKTMKDAERHVKILERRKSILAQEDASKNTKIFGITIGKKSE